MLTPEQAQRTLLDALRLLAPRQVASAEAAGLTLTQAVIAPHDHPPDDNSAMDGYAAASRDLQALPARLEVVGEATVRCPYPEPVPRGGAVAISTGATLPDGADTIIPVEDTTRDGDQVEVREARPDAFIRRRGGELRAGEVVLPTGTLLGPAALGLLCGLGITTVSARTKPRVAVLITGEEFGDAARPDANGPMLRALCDAHGGEVVRGIHVPDDTDALIAALREAQGAADVVISTGGASVGPHDHVARAWSALRVDVLFDRIAMKPGKPTHAGLLSEGSHRTLLLALPGNPLSVLTAFELLALPALYALRGAAPPPAEGRHLPLAQPLRLGSRAQLVRVGLTPGPDAPLVVADPRWNSAMLRQAALSRHVAFLPAGEGSLAAGTPVWVTPWAGSSWPQDDTETAR